MRENAFSSQLGPLIERHLQQENSIPMFMASLIKQLFKRAQVCCNTFLFGRAVDPELAIFFTDKIGVSWVKHDSALQPCF